MPSTRLNLTPAVLKALPADGQEHNLSDVGGPKSVPGLAVRVRASGAASFVLNKRVSGRLLRVTLGAVDALTLGEARDKARRTLADMTLTGANPNAAKRERRRQRATLAMAYADYVDGRGIKGGTRENYDRAMRLYLDRWRDTPLADITRDDVRRHHAACSKRSASATTTAFRLLRAIFTYADGHYVDTDGRPVLLDNPVRELSRKRLWAKPKARTARLRREDFAPWFAALPALEPLPRDYLRVVLLTGLRRREAATLEWHRIDLDARVPTATVVDTKNGDPLILPLSSVVVDILRERRRGTRSRFVFPSSAKSGHVEEPKNATAKLRELTGIEASPHALRRTFVSVAESIDIGPYTIKRLVNHRSGGDVTEAHYVDIELPRLLAATQAVTDAMLAYAGESEGANVVQLRAQA